MKCEECGTELQDGLPPDLVAEGWRDVHTRERCLEAQLAKARRERDRLQAGWQQALEAERDEANRRVEAESQLRATAAKLAKAREALEWALNNLNTLEHEEDFAAYETELRATLASLDPPEVAEKREQKR